MGTSGLVVVVEPSVVPVWVEVVVLVVVVVVEVTTSVARRGLWAPAERTRMSSRRGARAWTLVLVRPSTVAHSLQGGAQPRAVEVGTEPPRPAEGAQRHARAQLLGPAQLVVVRASEEVVEPEALLDRAA